MRGRTELVAIIQARMSSTRLPGKVMQPIAGIPLLQYLIERVTKLNNVDDVWVATSDRVEDEIIERQCKSLHVNCFRGSLTDVVERLAGALKAHPAEGFIRINADSPLIDPQLIDRGIELFSSGTFDLVTNVFPRTFPAGQSVEVLCTSVFLRTVEKMVAPEDREHVTRYFYRHSSDFRIRNFTHGTDLSGIQLAVDTPEDLRRLRDMVDRMEAPHWMYGLEDIVHLYRRVTVAGSRDACKN